jgi:hypothetical protein
MGIIDAGGGLYEYSYRDNTVWPSAVAPLYLCCSPVRVRPLLFNNLLPELRKLVKSIPNMQPTYTEFRQHTKRHVTAQACQE